jgi:membrane-associated phospholipid phosphatase
VFQAEPILWLQAHGSPALTWLLSLVSLVGYAPVYAAVLLALAFGLRLRPSFALLAAVLLSAILSEGLKLGLALPRPHDLDARVKGTVEGVSPAVVERGGAPGFWSLPPAEAIAAVRARAQGSFGFPSGHVASATALGLALVCLFRSRWALALAACWVAAMGLSRMYLGRHFLGDVLGGLAVGAVAAGLALRLFPTDDRAGADSPRARVLADPLWLALLLAALTPFVGALNPWYVGGFGGLAVSRALLRFLAVELDESAPGRRAARVALAVGLFVVTALAALIVLDTLASTESRPGALIAAVVTTTTTLAGTALHARRRGRGAAR